MSFWVWFWFKNFFLNRKIEEKIRINKEEYSVDMLQCLYKKKEETINKRENKTIERERKKGRFTTHRVITQKRVNGMIYKLNQFVLSAHFAMKFRFCIFVSCLGKIEGFSFFVEEDQRMIVHSIFYSHAYTHHICSFGYRPLSFSSISISLTSF